MRKFTSLVMLLFLCLCTGISAQSFSDYYIEHDGRDNWTWSVSTQCDSDNEEGAAPRGRKEAIYDGDASTYWHTRWMYAPAGDKLPQFIQIDLGSEKEIAGFEYSSRPNNTTGNTTAWRMYITSTQLIDMSTYNPATAEGRAAASEASLSAYNDCLVRGVFANGAGTKQAVFAPKRGRYVLLVSDRSQSGGHFCCSELDLLSAGANDLLDKDALKRELTEFLDTWSLCGEGEGVGYADDVFKALLTKAEAVNNDENSTAAQLEECVGELKYAKDFHINMPQAGKDYLIVSGLPAFKIQQSVEKAMYRSGENFKWGTIDETNLNFYWTVTSSGSAYRIISSATETAINGIGTLGAGKDITLRLVAPGQFNIFVQGTNRPLHALSHGSGAGVSGGMTDWDGGKETASSWIIREMNRTALANAYKSTANEMIAKYVSSHDETPVVLNHVSTASYNDLVAAVTALETNTTAAAVKIVNDKMKAVIDSKVMPVFTIASCIGYGSGRNIAEDEVGGTNHFNLADGKNPRMLWAIDFESENPKTGTFRAYNFQTRNGMHSRDTYADEIRVANAVPAVGETDDVLDQYLIYQEGSGNPLHAQDAGKLVVTYGDRGAKSGSAWKFEYVGITSELAGLEKYVKCEEALVAIDNLKSEQSTISAAGRLNGELNAYTYNGAKTIDQFTNDLRAIPEDLTGFDAFLSSLKAARFDINLPADGSFIRVRNIKGNTDNAKKMMYLYGENSDVEGQTNCAKFFGTVDNKATVYYYKDGKLLSYGSGLYLTNNSDFAGYNGVAEGTNVAFKKSSRISQGAYNVTFNNGNRYLYARQEGYADAGNSVNADEEYYYWLEPVTQLAVTVNAYGYATLHAPVALTIPTGVEAYTGKLNADKDMLVLTKVENVIPANTPVVLVAEPATYNFDINTENTDAPVADNALLGTVSAQTVEARSVLTLQHIGTPGFYTYTGTTMPGFKAYLSKETAELVRGFIFGDDQTTGIDGVEADENAPAAVYDLSGRRVNKAVKGIYIVNGKKVILK